MNPKEHLATRIIARASELEAWHGRHASLAPPPFYCSLDLRDSGHKVVPVDSNLFPAGFNNICPDDRLASKPILKRAIERMLGAHGRKILILPEAHTSNGWYIENLFYLREMLTQAGLDVRVGWVPSLMEGESVPDRLELLSAT